MSNPKGAMREVMPVAAELVDWLREQLGREYADKLVRQGQVGRGGFYVAEIGPDGVFREFGRTKRGGRAALRDSRVVWIEKTEDHATGAEAAEIEQPVPASVRRSFTSNLMEACLCHVQSARVPRPRNHD